MVTAQVKRLHSPDVGDLASYVPENPTDFGFLLQVIAGPAGARGEESFDVMVCTPRWLSQNLGPDGMLIERHYLFVSQYDYSRLERFVVDHFSNVRGQSWKEVAEQLGRFGKWEFEDYRS